MLIKDQLPVLMLPALSYGPEVAALSATSGQVIAVLRQAIYLETREGQILAVAGPDAPDGPLTLRVPDLPALLAALPAVPTAPFRVADGLLTLAEQARVDYSAAPRWFATYPQELSPDTQAAQAALAAAIAAEGEQAGLGRLATLLPALPSRDPDPGGAGDLLLRRAAAALAAFLRAAAAGQTGPAADALIALLGLGPGLTPSGDDLVAGLLAVLAWEQRAGEGWSPPRSVGGGSARRESRLAPMSLPQNLSPVGIDPGARANRRAEPPPTDDSPPTSPVAGLAIPNLIAAVRAAAPQRTNRISARLLWHAGAGTLYAPALDLGAALFAGDAAAVAAPARRLFAIGHTSGIDLAVGLLAGVRLLAGPESPSGPRIPTPGPPA